MNTSLNPEYIKALWFDLSAGLVGIDPEAMQSQNWKTTRTDSFIHKLCD